jgi:carbamoyl-phosphate synthase large subunit
MPTFGICLGHQLMGLASGAKTLKMKFGHHGANHPVKDLDTGQVLITSQNHGFAVDPATLPANLRVTHVSLFDGSLQGMARTDVPAFCFQGHPEASPGPHDVAYLFDRFIDDGTAPPDAAVRKRMPKRTDINSILIIGAGPIVIGQACEFDYSGAQACKALRDEGYQGHPGQLQPGDDHDRPGDGRRHLHRADHLEMVEKIIAKERPDALLPTMGGQTALNCALDLAARRAGEVRRRDDRRSREAIDKAEDREKFKEAMTKIGLGSARSGIAHSMERRCRCRPPIGFPPSSARPSPWAAPAAASPTTGRVRRPSASARLEASPDQRELLIEEVAARLEGIRDGGGPRPQGQLHHRLLDREPRSDGRAHRRLDHRRAGADADRQGIPDHAQRLDRGAARDRRRHRRLQRAVRDQPADGRMIVIEMNPRVSRSSALASKATGFPDRQGRGQAGRRLHARRTANDITGGATPASFEPSIDYVVTKMPRFAFEKFPRPTTA